MKNIIPILIIIIVTGCNQIKYGRLSNTEELSISSQTVQEHFTCNENTDLFKGIAFEHNFSFCYNPQKFSIEPTWAGFKFFLLNDNGKRIDANKKDTQGLTPITGGIYYRGYSDAESYFAMRRNSIFSISNLQEPSVNQNGVRAIKFDMSFEGKQFKGYIFEDKANEGLLKITFSSPMEKYETDFIRIFKDTIQFNN